MEQGLPASGGALKLLKSVELFGNSRHLPAHCNECAGDSFWRNLKKHVKKTREFA